jgi:hypothetical protein
LTTFPSFLFLLGLIARSVFAMPSETLFTFIQYTDRLDIIAASVFVIGLFIFLITFFCLCSNCRCVVLIIKRLVYLFTRVNPFIQ